MPELQQFFSPAYYSRLFYTIRPLKWQQVFYRLYYPFKRLIYRPAAARQQHLNHARAFPGQGLITTWQHSGIYDPSDNRFFFLNQAHAFGAVTDWDYKAYGLLWTYHLNYFDWLADDSLSVALRLETIKAYVAAFPGLKIARDSFPASLRITNWIRFLSANGITDEEILRCLYQQGRRLQQFPEYQLQANHLLENRITYAWLAIYFDPASAAAAFKKLDIEIAIQIMDDGAHYERSIMYHIQLWRRLLELYAQLAGMQAYASSDELNRLKINLLKMNSWARQMQFTAGNFPHFGDSCEKNISDFTELCVVAQDLLVDTAIIPLSSSGYRRTTGDGLELFFNCGAMTPVYQPGHAHADLFSFCLNAGGRPLIVDTGISTYETGTRRVNERGTAAHNTVVIAGADSSDVWNSFRVGKRAVPELLIDSDQELLARHDGYKHSMGIVHERHILTNGSSLTVTDRLEGWTGQAAQLNLHFYPGIELIITGNSCRVAGTGIEIICDNCDVYKEYYEYCYGFNERGKAIRLCAVIKGAVINTVIKIDHDKIY